MSFFLGASDNLSMRCGEMTKCSPTTIFPLPAPHPGFCSSGPGLRRRDLSALAMKRVLHITVLNLLELLLSWQVSIARGAWEAAECKST